ncbi:hypothetical protein [Antarctobacter heliothermus]|uniref:Uncharacterized protein n=1 Tax=Antarctobacter heliothermus TaxID=74033 RepID=A0A239MD71_9RHOB|nr:hypothetical protein [Antarctobacter heliothermus]SNT40004.1 hypothetical protein SAMN04488078_11403 [Antarctobacter heliothermus]
METKHEKFLRLYGGRIERAESAIDLLGNLSSPNYEHTSAEAEEMVDRLRTAVDQVAESFGLIDMNNQNSFVIETETPKPIQEIDYSALELRVLGGAIPGRDRRDIREALRTLQDGNTAEGIKQLQKVICGWIVPDKIEGEAA